MTTSQPNPLGATAKRGFTALSVLAAGTLAAATYFGTSAGNTAEAEIERPDSPTELIFETAWPTAITLWRPDRYFVDLVNTIAYGHVEIDWYDGGTLTTSTDMFDDVRAGSIDMGSDWPSYWEGRNTAFSLVTSVPMIFSPNDYMTWFWQGGGYELANEVYAQYNLKWFPHNVTSPESGQRTNVRVESPEDYEGLRLRQCGRNQSRILEDLGASAVFTPGGEVYAALDRGVLDGAEFSVPEVDWNMGLQEATDYLVLPGWHQPGPVSGIMVNQQAYDELNDYTKFAMKQAAQATMMWSWTYFDYTSGEYTQRFLDAGIELTRLEDDVLDQVMELTEERIIGDAEENPDHAKLAVSMYDYLVTMAKWRQYQQPFMHGHVWDSLEETHERLVEIAQDHGVYEETMDIIADARQRNEDQGFWQPGDTYETHPVRD